MPIEARAKLWFILLLCSLGCADKTELKPTPVEIRVGSPRVTQGPQATSIELELEFKNPTTVAQEIFVIITAHNNEPRPPSRMIWPSTAEPELRNSFAGLVVALPERGYRVELAPGAESAVKTAMVGAADRRVFKEYWVQAFDKSGQLVFDRRGDLR